MATAEVRAATRPELWAAARAVAVLVAAAALLPISPAAAQRVDTGSVVSVIEGAALTPASPDSAGITYRPDLGAFLMCDSEVNETVEGISHYEGVNVWLLTATGEVLDGTTTVPWSNEPTGIAYDPAGGRLWVSDDVRDSVYEVDLGEDGIFGTADDTRERLRGYVDAGCEDLEDLAYDFFEGCLYLVGGTSQRICRVDVGANGVFDGAPPWGDDETSSIDLAGLGPTDPEGIAHDPFWNTLVVADRGTRRLYELSPDGSLLRRIDVDFPASARLSGITIAPGSTNPALRNYWVTDRGVDNNTDPLAVDGRIYEVVALPLGGNAAPVVDAGPPKSLLWPESEVELAGFVSDDGHPHPPSTVLVVWSQLEGPGSVSFEDASLPSTTAWFPGPGSYVLELSADDSAAQAADQVAVVVQEPVTVTVSTVGSGSVQIDPPSASYPPGATVMLTAAPGATWTFAGWSGDATGTHNPLPLLMDGNKVVQARFRLRAATGCGIGPELAVLVPLLARLGRRRRS